MHVFFSWTMNIALWNSCHEDNGEASSAFLDASVVVSEAIQPRGTRNALAALPNCTGDVGIFERYLYLDKNVDDHGYTLPDYTDDQLIEAADQGTALTPNVDAMREWQRRLSRNAV